MAWSIKGQLFECCNCEVVCPCSAYPFQGGRLRSLHQRLRISHRLSPWTDPGSFGFYISTWVVMMTAMMLPSLVPMVLVFRRLEHARSAPPVATSAFVIGYLVVWTASGLVAYAAMKAGKPGASSPAITPAGHWRALRYSPQQCTR